MTPFEGVGLGHGDESKQTQSLTLPSAAPVFATQLVIPTQFRNK